MNRPEFRSFAKEVIRRSVAAYLATIHHHYPVIRAMVNLRNPDLYPRQSAWLNQHMDPLTLVFSTLASSNKVAQVRKNPKVSVLYSVPSEFKEITFFGEMEICFDAKIRDAIFQEDWRIYYPDGPQDPGHAILKMIPQRAEVWKASRKFVFDWMG